MRNLLAMFFVMMILLTGCSNEPPVEVKTDKVIASDGALTLTRNGQISLSNEQKVLSSVSGNVIEKFFNDGDEVTEGQQLFKIGSKEAETELLQAKQELAEAMTTLAKEAAQKKPVEDLQAEVAERQALIKKLEDESAAGIVYSLMAGQVNIGSVRLGADVKADETVLATIGKDNPVIVRFEVSEAEKNVLSTGKPKVTLKFIDGTTYPREGKLTFNGTTAEATFDNPIGLLLLGHEVRLEISGSLVPNTLLVPEQAIHQRDGGDYVFAVDSNKAVLKKVSLGGKIGNQFIVDDGLKAGEEVVVEGLSNLHEGTPLSVTNDK
ncbi:MAG: efflux RND transporter periplasmic adaptor subunit [Selenomonadaceae bacterium]|nr:efflux RND transporter periplasmic adaptor subunit [Selenomonadaceae bacterium]